VSQFGLLAPGDVGPATVIGLTVNHQQWLPDFAPPYVIANVALADDPSIHLTTNIVNCEPDDVRPRRRGASAVRDTPRTCGSRCSN
jgi:hypothetical protein